MIKVKVDYKDKVFIKELLRKAFPLIIGTILIGLTNLVDNAMIGFVQQSGSGELSASSLAQKYVSISTVFIAATISLFSFLIFQYKGAKNQEKIKETIKIMNIFVVILDIILIVVPFFLSNEIMRAFQGDNYDSSISTSSGIAQDYVKVLAFNLIASSLFLIYINVANAYGKQKILMIITAISILVNILFNYLLYEVASLGLDGIAYSTIIGQALSLLILIGYLHKRKLSSLLSLNILTWYKIDKEVLVIGLKRWAMALQTILWSFISIGITIIYSNWYGDAANERLAIVVPVARMFYSALDGIANTKGYFVGTNIGKGDKEVALINDKRINLYTFIVASIEGILMAGLAFVIPMAWSSIGDDAQWDITLMLISIGLTYPIAAVSKCLLGSFKVAGMGKTIILSNGLFALFFEFTVPLILFILYKNGIVNNLEFWELYMIARIVKLIKLPPTYYFWRKQKWLEKAI